VTTSSQYSTNIFICKVSQWSSKFQTQTQSQRPGRFSNASQTAPIGRWVKKEDVEYLFEHGEVINYILDGINTPSHYKDTGVLPNSVAGEEGNCSGISP
jgi:hypothetical protein